MPKCHVSGDYIKGWSNCATCHTRSCPVVIGMCDEPLPDDENTLAQKKALEKKEKHK